MSNYRSNNSKNKKYLFFVSSMLIIFIVAFLVLYNQKQISVNIPILMYHDIKLDSKNQYVVSEERFFEDMCYLEREGYTALLPEDFIKVASNEVEAPEKPIMITFDDGYYGNYEYAYPVLKATNMKAVIGVIASNMREDDIINNIFRDYENYIPPTYEEIEYEDNSGKPIFMSWNECKEIYESGIIAIESHTYNLHNPDSGGMYVDSGPNGIQKKHKESNSDYYHRFKEDLEKSIELIESNVGNTVKYFTYPYGQTEKIALNVLKELNISLATTTVNGISKTSRNWLTLPRINVTMETSLEELLLLNAK